MMKMMKHSGFFNVLHGLSWTLMDCIKYFHGFSMDFLAFSLFF